MTAPEVRDLARALATTLLPDGALEDRNALLWSIPDHAYRDVMSRVLELAEELLASLTSADEVDHLEQTLQRLCVHRSDELEP
jgi:hypothetical protein